MPSARRPRSQRSGCKRSSATRARCGTSCCEQFQLGGPSARVKIPGRSGSVRQGPLILRSPDTCRLSKSQVFELNSRRGELPHADAVRLLTGCQSRWAGIPERWSSAFRPQKAALITLARSPEIGPACEAMLDARRSCWHLEGSWALAQRAHEDVHSQHSKPPELWRTWPGASLSLNVKEVDNRVPTDCDEP